MSTRPFLRAAIGVTVSAICIALPAVSSQAALPNGQALSVTAAAAATHRSQARPAASATRAPAPLKWSRALCSEAVQDYAADLPRPSLVDCAALTVPLNRSRPSAGSISLRITRVRSSAPTRSTRTLFVNPGGPGVAADWLAPALAAQIPALHRSHAIIAVDPRGTGGSTPVSCDLPPSRVTDLRRADAAKLRTLQVETATMVRRCTSTHAKILPHINTRETVADLDAVRARLGVSVIDWYGVSAGTWLGARYAAAHPRRTGRIILDSTVDITTTWRASFAHQPRGFQRRYSTQFVPWVARHDASFGLGRTPATVTAAIEKIRARAAAGRLGALTPTGLDVLIASRLYDDRDFDVMASDLAALADGPSASRLAAIGRDAEQARTTQRLGTMGRSDAQGSARPSGLTDAEDAVFMAVQCNDDTWSRSAGSYAAEGRSLGVAYPLIGWTWLTSPCATWPFRPTPLTPLRPHSLPAMLALQNELDPATPWEGAKRVLKAQKRVRAVVVDDEGSHGVLIGRNRCAVDRGVAYLTTGRLPAADVVCAGTAVPGDRSVFRIGARLSAATIRR